MLLNRLTMCNFGVFENAVDLRLGPTSAERPLVLIQGENGSGKTTILEAIKIALYGPQLVGNRTATESYFTRINSRLNRRARTRPSSRYFVTLELTIVEKGQKSTYAISREWRINQLGQLRETVTVRLNDSPLRGKGALDFEEYIRRFLPIGAFDMLFLDGERLNELFEGDNFTREIGKTILPLCGLDVYQRLEVDLDAYLRSENSYDSLDADQLHYQELRTRYDDLLKERTRLAEEQRLAEATLESTKAALLSYERDLRAYGVKEITQHQQQLSQLEQRRKELNEITKSYIAEVLPFAICRPLLEQIATQLREEERQFGNEQIRAYLQSPEVLEHLRASLTLDGAQKLEVLEQIRTALAGLPAETEQPIIIHGLSPEQKVTVFSVLSGLQEGAGPAFDEIAATAEEIAQLRKQQALVGDMEIAGLLESIKAASARVAEIQVMLVDIGDAQEKLRQESSALESELARSAEQVFRSRRDENIFMLSHRVKSVLDRFVGDVLRDYSLELGESAMRYLGTMLRKQRFVDKIEVNPASLRLNLYDDMEQPIDPLGLSAGEKQLLLLSVLWASLRTAHRQLPLVFDTLIGRLDATHKRHVLAKALPEMSQQVILFVTDTEISEEDFLMLRPRIGRAIHLAYLDDSSRTEVREGSLYEL